MSTVLEQLCDAVKWKDIIECQMVNKGAALKAQIADLQETLKKLNAEDADRVAHLDKNIRQYKDEILDVWDIIYGDEKQIIHNGFIIDRKANRRPVIPEGKDHDLLLKLECVLTPEAKRPYTFKWNQRGLVKAIDAGIVPEDLAVVEVQHSISVTPPHDEEVGP